MSLEGDRGLHHVADFLVIIFVESHHTPGKSSPGRSRYCSNGHLYFYDKLYKGMKPTQQCLQFTSLLTAGRYMEMAMHIWARRQLSQ